MGGGRVQAIPSGSTTGFYTILVGIRNKVQAGNCVH